MPQPPHDIVLTTEELQALQALRRSGRGRADLARRAEIILCLADGASYLDIQRGVGEHSRTIAKWKARFLEARVAGLQGRYAAPSPTVLTPALEARILAWTRKPPSTGATHWSTRTLAKALKLSSHTFVQRAWQRAGLQPHRIERYMRSTDPDFEPKAADVIGLYLDPPQHAAVFCLDEKTAIQALDRLDPVLPLSPGRAERHGFEYYRHGTLSLYAALNTQTGRFSGRRRPATRVTTFSPSSPRSSTRSRADATCTSFSTTWPRTKPRRSARFSPHIRGSTCISRRPTRLGSTRSNCGSPRSSGTSSPAASSRPSPTCGARSSVTCVGTTPPPSPSDGRTRTPPGGSLNAVHLPCTVH